MKDDVSDNRVLMVMLVCGAVVIAVFTVCVTIYESVKLSNPPRPTVAATSEVK